MIEINNIDCMEYMSQLADKSIDFTLTDIPYDEVQRETNGLSNLKNLDNLGDADKLKFGTEITFPTIAA